MTLIARLRFTVHTSNPVFYYFLSRDTFFEGVQPWRKRQEVFLSKIVFTIFVPDIFPPVYSSR